MSSNKSYAVRRRPGQDRSKKRVALILDAAKSLLAGRGTEPFSMTKVAAKAGMGLTALYRYFPNKTAILSELSAQMLEQDRNGLLLPSLEIEVSVDEYMICLAKLYSEMHRKEPYRIPLRIAIQADQELVSLDLQDVNVNSEIIANKVTSLAKVQEIDNLKKFSLLGMNLLHSTFLLMYYMDDEKEADALLDSFLTMILHQIHSILEEEGKPIEPQA